MTTIDLMLSQHPQVPGSTREAYASVISTLAVCEQVCTACADACLGETEHVHRLARCIRISLDCADICAATLCVLTRQTEPSGTLVQAQLQSCVIACQTCADECAEHASMHGHCATCAETCRHCQTECNRLMVTISSSGIRDESGSGFAGSIG